jgi:hypothetical protein
MYLVDERDQVVELRDIPAFDPGASAPAVLANDLTLVLAYRAFGDSDDFVILEFARARAHYFGAPNDEALRGHPLTSRGLTPYASFEVLNSSWIRLLEARNRVHQQHDPKRFLALRHFILTFHDSIFECVAADVSIVSRNAGHTEFLDIMFQHLKPFMN